MALSVSDSRFDLYRREVKDLADAHTSFGEVEAAVEATDLTVDERAALLMLGWSLIETGTETGTRQGQAKAELHLVGNSSSSRSSIDLNR